MELDLRASAEVVPDDERATAEVVFLDKENTTVWLWSECFDKKRYVFNREYAIGQVADTAVFKSLAHVSIDPVQCNAIATSINVSPPTLGDHASADSLLDLVRAQADRREPDRGFLSWIGHLAQSDYASLCARGLASWLGDHYLPSLLSVEWKLQRRTPLFKELQQRIRDGGVVFLLGGQESGIDFFIDGFEGFLEEDQYKADIHVDFIDKIRAFQEKLIAAQFGHGADSYPNLNALLAALAFSACRSILNDPTRKEAVEGLISPGALDSPERFANHYFTSAVPRETADGRTQHSRAVGQQRIGGCVQHFFAFLEYILNAVEAEKRMTVLMPLDSLGMVLNRDSRGRALRTTDDDLPHVPFNYEEARSHLLDGLVEGHGSAEGIRRVGLLVKATRLPLTNMSTKIIRESVLAFPPFDRSELDEVLTITFGLKASADAVDLVARETGGVPWFVDLTIKALKEIGALEGLVSQPDQCEKLKKAIDKICSAIADRASDDTFKEFIDDYRVAITQVLKHADLNIDLVHTTWRHAARTMGTLQMSERLERLIESGLFWPRSRQPEDRASFNAFRRYKSFSLYPAPPLAQALVSSLDLE